MAGELWTSIASMVGVLVGGGLTFMTQRATQRAVERVEERKQQSALAEARRSEQIHALLEFIRFAHEAEGVAHARPPSWEVGDDWYRTARPAMDGLRVAEKSVELLCDTSLQAPTASYARALNHAIKLSAFARRLLSRSQGNRLRCRVWCQHGPMPFGGLRAGG
jgi:hypothetical protein